MTIEQYEDTQAQYTSLDLTTIHRDKFRDILDFLGLNDYHKLERDGRYRYMWTNGRDMTMVTACNPLTGEFNDGEQHEDRKDYASYMVVAAASESLTQMVLNMIDYKASHVKDQGMGFMGLSDEIVERSEWME